MLFSGTTCEEDVWPIPAWAQGESTPDADRILQPGTSLASGSDFGQSTGTGESPSLEPGEWSRFVVDTRSAYGTLNFTLVVTNENANFMSEGGTKVLFPLLLVKPADGGASLPSLDADSKTIYDFNGAMNSTEQTVMLEGSTISNRYYVAVHNQLYSRATLKYSLRVTSTAQTAYSSSRLRSCELSPCVDAHTQSCTSRETSSVGERVCECHPAWEGSTCNSPKLRPAASLLKAATDILNLGVGESAVVPLSGGDFRFFKVPQPLLKGQGMVFSVCDTTASGSSSAESDECCAGSTCSDPDIYVSSQLPRSSYDFQLISAFPNSSKEELTVYDRSKSGRYYLAVYANYDGNFRVSTAVTKRAQPEPKLTDSYFLELLGIWLTEELTGQVTLAVASTMMSILCLGCCCACCCKHEDLHSSEIGESSRFNSAARTFGRIIGSNPRMHNNPPKISKSSSGSNYGAGARAQARRAMEAEMEQAGGSHHARDVSIEMANPVVGRGRRSMI